MDIGIDGGGLDDLLGLVVAGRDAKTRDWLVIGRAWAHPSVLERRQSEAPRFRDFARDGDLVLVEMIGDDVEEVASIVLRVWQSGKLDKIGVDPVGIGAIVDAIVELGVPQELIVGISQGWKLAGAIKTTERKLAEGGLFHSGSPLMAWCVGNARVEPRANSMLITKQASGTAKIDPLMALFNAVSLLSLNPASNTIGSDFELLVVG
jgi:phage terminase large subunit-like protein